MNIKKKISNSASKVSLPVTTGNETYNVPGKDAYFKQELIDRIRAHVEMMSQPIARRGVYYNRPPADITLLQEKLSRRSHDCHCPKKFTKEETVLQTAGHTRSCTLKPIKEEKMSQSDKKKMHTKKLKRMKLKTKSHKLIS